MKTRILSVLLVGFAVMAFSVSAQAGLFCKRVCVDECCCEVVIKQCKKIIYEKQEVPCEITVREKVPYTEVVTVKKCKLFCCKPVFIEKEITCYKWECKKVPGTKTICVPKTIIVDVPVKVCPKRCCFRKHCKPVVAPCAPCAPAAEGVAVPAVSAP
ncbi:MAG: hypothetical protein FWE67_09675 [Planctomycetaceae bacterium]|nr:hypothetical protein [Planctomycetaceae bacterium]